MALHSNLAVLFPGQGSSVADAVPLVSHHCPDLYERSVATLGADPFERAAESTRFAQPAIFLASIAGWRSLADAELDVCAFAGHSLGELSALAAAGTMSESDALELVILRGRLMADAADRARIEGGMLAVLKGSPEQASQLADEFSLVVANDNAPGQSVLSGPRSDLQRASAAARGQGLRAIALDVSGAFHSPAMAPAMAPFETALWSARLRAPSAPVFSSLTARPLRNVPVELTNALCSPVNWRETMLALDRAGAQGFLDVGPDRVLARLVERNLPGREVAELEALHVGA